MSLEDSILTMISNYVYYHKELVDLEERLREKCFKMTASYGGVGHSTAIVNQVESYCISRYKLKESIGKYKRKLALCDQLLELPVLTEREREILIACRDGRCLLEYSRANGVCKSYVYKIRDRAIKKIAKYVRSKSICVIHTVIN